MSRVFVSEATGAAVYVFADDHCPPHVHARHRGEGWIARVGFSYLGSEVELMSIAPLKRSPLRRVTSVLLDDVRARLAECRRAWWTTRRTTCLANQWAIVSGGSTFALCPERISGAKQIMDAGYDPETGRHQVIFLDGTATGVSTPA